MKIDDVATVNGAYACRYTARREFGTSIRHSWVVESAKVAIELWITERDPTSSSERVVYGGVESHYRIPPAYMEGRAPSHYGCHALQVGPCWHDGSGLAANEFTESFSGASRMHGRVFDYLAQRIEKSIRGDFSGDPGIEGGCGE